MYSGLMANVIARVQQAEIHHVMKFWVLYVAISFSIKLRLRLDVHAYPYAPQGPILALAHH